MVFIAIATIILCSLPFSLTNLITINAVKQEHFTYEIVVPQVLQLSKSFSLVDNWKDKYQTYLTSQFHHKHSLKKFLNNNIRSYYRINAFNQTFDLSIIKDETFLSPSFVIQHFDENQTWLTKDIEHCFYNGYVNKDPLSIVSISLCNGLFGTFIYNNIEYFIEPKYDNNNTEWNFNHLLYTYNSSLIINKEKLIDDKQSSKERLQLYKEKKSFKILSNIHIEHRSKRQLYFDPMVKHVKVLVVYDKSIDSFHPNIDIKSYILTLFSYVSRLYSDTSIGNNIKIWIVKLINLSDSMTDYFKSDDDANDIFNKFCTWQQSYNTTDTYDVAVLFTRIPLCYRESNNIMNRKCDILEVTKSGTMCDLKSSCVVVRDNGFATAFTIAHGIAHLFDIPHDISDLCLNYTNEENLMASSLTFKHNHYKWSNCSRHYFTKYINADRYTCLNNIPNYTSTFKDLNNEQKLRELPGRFYDLNEQCRRAFGSNYEYCIGLSHGPKCNRLYCHEISSNISSCRTNHAHWSDGTLCSEQKSIETQRCLRGQCRSIKDFEIINGNWGEWSSWSPCTRTCGSAIQKSERFCDNPKPENGGQYCSGQSIRIRSCEYNQPCKDPVDTFRLRQCSAFNNRTVDPLLPIGVRFEPKYNVKSYERCKLICKVSDDRLERSFILRDHVEDGTLCGREEETKDICINGTCMSIGCDNKYQSNATVDICGVCNGQNKTCQLIRGYKIVSDFGITNIIDIPINTTYVKVTQISSHNDRYYIAVKYINGTYILNGINSLQLYNVKIRINGAILYYTGSDSINESISIIGRLKFPLEIQVISIYQNGVSSTLINWEYYTPIDQNDLLEKYDNHCDRPCQGFKQIQKCFIHGKEYDLIYCLTYNISFTYKKEHCNNHCFLSWIIQHEQTCSTRCGEGWKRVIYGCIKTNYTDQSIELIREDICQRYIGEKPKDILSCIGNCTGIGWVYGNWGECHYDNGCIRKRLAECRNEMNLSIASNYCISDFIKNIERCSDISCNKSQWNLTSWSDCDCILKQRRRNVTCVHLNKQVNDKECIHELKPNETISCNDECFTSQWKTDIWQPCMGTCSSRKGVQHRRVFCFYNGSIVKDDYCIGQPKPAKRKSCRTNINCSIWSIGLWSSCSVTCGKGIQRRTVECTEHGRLIEKSKCLQPMPIEQQICTSLNSTCYK